LTDLAPISLINKYYYAIGLSNAVPADDVQSFLTYARKHPGEVNYATQGTGSTPEILAHQLEKLAGIKMTAVPFGGGAQPLQELLAGRIQVYVTSPIAFLQQYRAKQLKILAITSPERLEMLPDVPTATEVGINLVRSGWLGICAPAGTPDQVIQRLSRQIAEIVNSNDYRKLMESAGSTAESSSPDELAAIMQQTVIELKPTVREFNLRRD
jgi:tripartite-type tricarboxylate transporter receptor subunit TctC